MPRTTIINLTPENIINYGVCGYKDLKKHVELRNKIDWFKKYYPKGLRIKAVIAGDGSYQGMLEYIPGKLAHRPVEAKNYMFIHCVFVGFKKEFKGKGLASSLIKECIAEAKKQKMDGVAVVTRSGSFMANNAIFIKNKFTVFDRADPDFELLALKFNKKAKDPQFKDLNKNLEKYKKGLFVMRSVQCPYTEKNVKAILETAKDKFKLKAKLIDLKSPTEIQKSPCAFGTFCLIYDGKILSHHPNSNTRFENIMKQEMGHKI